MTVARQTRPRRVARAAVGVLAVGAALVVVHLNRVAQAMPAQPEGPSQPVATPTPTNWLAEASVFGVVQEANATGTPAAIAGARVILHAGENRCDQSVVTGSSGAFELSCYDLHFENQFVVHVVADGYQRWQTGGLFYARNELGPDLERIPTDPSPTPTPFDVQTYVITTGSVRDALDGHALADARVSVGALPYCLSPVRSDQEGHYELVCPGIASLSTYSLTASMPGYTDRVIELFGYELGSVIDLDLEREGAVTVWVPDCRTSSPP